MSRSRSRTPLLANTTRHSEKQDKKIANHKCRAAVRSAMAHDPEGDLPDMQDVSSVWTMGKDEKVWRDPSQAWVQQAQRSEAHPHKAH
jgi:hypothetical protein